MKTRTDLLTRKEVPQCWPSKFAQADVPDVKANHANSRGRLHILRTRPEHFDLPWLAVEHSMLLPSQGRTQVSKVDLARLQPISSNRPNPNSYAPEY